MLRIARKAPSVEPTTAIQVRGETWSLISSSSQAGGVGRNAAAAHGQEQLDSVGIAPRSSPHRAEFGLFRLALGVQDQEHRGVADAIAEAGQLQRGAGG